MEEYVLLHFAPMGTRVYGPFPSECADVLQEVLLEVYAITTYKRPCEHPSADLGMEVRIGVA